jgi:hypothetical protein
MLKLNVNLFENFGVETGNWLYIITILLHDNEVKDGCSSMYELDERHVVVDNLLR